MKLWAPRPGEEPAGWAGPPLRLSSSLEPHKTVRQGRSVGRQARKINIYATLGFIACPLDAPHRPRRYPSTCRHHATPSLLPPCGLLPTTSTTMKRDGSGVKPRPEGG